MKVMGTHRKALESSLRSLLIGGEVQDKIWWISRNACLKNEKTEEKNSIDDRDFVHPTCDQNKVVTEI